MVYWVFAAFFCAASALLETSPLEGKSAAHACSFSAARRPAQSRVIQRDGAHFFAAVERGSSDNG
jgi:hypothetical protein